jgi:single-strand DNA-binding protein
MNSWSFTGHLGRDAETRFTQGGDAVVTFTVAVKTGYGKNEGTTWARCQMWGSRGEAVAPYLTKGQHIGVVGEVSLREWQTKTGETRRDLEVRVVDLTLLGKRDGDQPQQSTPRPRKPAAQEEAQWTDDIPF